MITEEYTNQIKQTVDSYYGGDPKVLEAAKEWASIKAARLMGGRYHTDFLFREFHEKYDASIGAQGIEAVDITNNDYSL